MKIAVLVSGGVDSSVALHKLKKQGHDVEAFYLKIWLEDEMSFLGECPWEEDVKYAQDVCNQCDVKLHIVSLQKEYHDRVVRYTIDAVKNGLTPNPDMLCNREVKFGAFYDKYGKDFDKIATGHYARTVKSDDGLIQLLCAPDPIKDQTYFLAMMRQEQLQKALFPIGDMKKSDVRTYARDHGLVTANRKDSQGICFLGKISFTEFIKQHLGIQKGIFIEKETGKELGEHDGFYFYTIGQRRGIDLGGGPWYVCDKDVEKNIVYLTHGFTGKDQRRDHFDVRNINWFCGFPDKKELLVKLRHGAHFYQCSIVKKENNSVHVHLDEKDQGITPGQYAVFYDAQICLGGGVIA
ncbi:MAG: tRNA 2-thiouridine(34) synthase MnmA [Candidatus Moraniibacteriota bacterium]|nr:MAG: tRNA 2-thiouridine(34) synthase MnmA [Candidatus Moranbacteria bacterium]